MSEISLTVCDVCGEKASAEGAKNWRHIQLTDGNGYGKTWERDLCTSCWGKGEPLLGWPPSTRRNLETYFAADAQNLVARVAGRVEECAQDFDFSHCATAREHLFESSVEMGSQTQVTRVGAEGEQLKVRASRPKAIRESLVGLWLNAPINWRATAKTADAQSRGAVAGAQSLLESEWKRGMSTFALTWAKAACAYREAYAFPDWNKGGGEPTMGDDSGHIFFEGATRVRLIMPWDCVFDLAYKSWEELPWVAVRTTENKWAVAALEAGGPDKGEAESDEEFNARQAKRQAILTASEWMPPKFRRRISKDTDTIGVWHLFHRSDAAVPGGLSLRFINPQVMLGQPGPCRRIPVKRACPAVREDTPLGDSQWLSILGLDQLLNSTDSAVASNFDALATQIVATDPSMSIETHPSGLIQMKVPAGSNRPEGVNLVRNPEGYGDWREAVKADELDIVGLNDVSQGQPDTAQMNAAAFAQLRGAAIERNTGAQKMMFAAIAELGLELLLLCAENMSGEQYLSVAGKSGALNIPTRKVYPSQLGMLSEVAVDIGTPQEQSPAGRGELLTHYIQIGAINASNAEQIPHVIETGRMEPVTDPAKMESLLIDFENQQISFGETPPVHARQNHLRHYQGHAVNCSNPTILGDPAAMEADEAHCDWHYREYWGLPEGMVPKADPLYFDRVRIMLGQQPPGQIGPPPIPASAAPPSQEQPPSDSPEGAPAALSQPQQPSGPQSPNVPTMPV